MTTSTCPVCGKEYLTYPCRVKGGKRPLCSKACQIKKAPRNCTACGKEFICKSYRLSQERVYCSRECSLSDSHFARVPTWNKGMKGIHLSPTTEFKKGHGRDTAEPIGTLRFRKHKGDARRAWVKVAQPNSWELRAKVVWITAHGPIPRGMVVHHEDRNALNDDLSNLGLLTRAEHLNEHRDEIRPPRKKAATPE